ncbi:MAG TPA: TolC family protein [Pseudomonadota bacterium]|nr:TolC family protein [Pseudomonadota bacterium]
MMQKAARRLLSLLAACLWMGQSHAEPPIATEPLAPLQLSLEEAVRRAEEYVPALVRAKNDALITAAKRAGAAVLLSQNPYATFLGGYRQETTSSPTATGFQYQFHIEQPIEFAGQRSTRIQAVNTQLAVASANTSYARALTRAMLQVAYIQAVLAEQRVAVDRSREEIGMRLLDSAKVRFNLGAAGDIEVNLAQIEGGRVAAERVQAEVAHEERLAELRILCGLPAHLPLRLVTTLTEPPQRRQEHQGIEALARLAEEQRTDLQAMVRQHEVFGSERRRLIRETIPSLVLSFDLQRDLPGQEFYGGSVGIGLPLWNRNQGPLAQVAAGERARQNEERLLRVRIRNEVALAHRKMALLRSQEEAFQKTVLPLAERNLELLRRGWQAGKFDLFRVITASRELAETRLRHLDLLDDLWKASIELERAVGVPILGQGVP